MIKRTMALLFVYWLVLFTPLMADKHSQGVGKNWETQHWKKKHWKKNKCNNRRSRPKAESQSLTILENSSNAITLIGTTKDNRDLNFTITCNPQHGTLEGTPPNITYIPNVLYIGADGFTFRVTDGYKFSKIATIKIKTIPIDTYPSIQMKDDLTLEIGKSMLIDGASYCQKGKNLSYKWVQDGVTLSTSRRFTYLAKKTGDHTL